MSVMNILCLEKLSVIATVLNGSAINPRVNHSYACDGKCSVNINECLADVCTEKQQIKLNQSITSTNTKRAIASHIIFNQTDPHVH